MIDFQTHPESGPDNILVLDFESNCLGFEKNFHPLELAAKVVNKDLEVIGTFGPTVFSVPQEAMDAMGDFVTKMHTETGLLERMKNGRTFQAADIDHYFAGFIQQFFPFKGDTLPDGTTFRGVVIGGNSLAGVDIPALRDFMPLTYSQMSYRTIDVSSINELMKRIAPEILATMPPKESDHTALKDIDECIKELRYYRDAAFAGTRA